MIWDMEEVSVNNFSLDESCWDYYIYSLLICFFELAVNAHFLSKILGIHK